MQSLGVQGKRQLHVDTCSTCSCIVLLLLLLLLLLAVFAAGAASLFQAANHNSECI